MKSNSNLQHQFQLKTNGLLKLLKLLGIPTQVTLKVFNGKETGFS